jgi:hypothetical protein
VSWRSFVVSLSEDSGGRGHIGGTCSPATRGSQNTHLMPPHYIVLIPTSSRKLFREFLQPVIPVQPILYSCRASDVALKEPDPLSHRQRQTSLTRLHDGARLAQSVRSCPHIKAKQYPPSSFFYSFHHHNTRFSSSLRPST